MQFLTFVDVGHKAVPYSCGFRTQSSSLQLWVWDTMQPLTFVSLAQKQFLTFVGLGHQAVPYCCGFGTPSSPLHVHSTLTSTVFFCRKQPVRQQTARASRVAEPVIHYTETKVESRCSGCVHFSNFVLSTRTRKQCCIQLASLKTCFVDTTVREVARGGDQETGGDAFVCRSGTPGCCLVRPRGCAMLTGDTPSVRSHCQQPCLLICVLACNNDTAVTAPS